MRDRNLSSGKEHYFIVLNANPCADEIILLSVATSKIENQRRRIRIQGESPETLVIVSPQEYSVFSVPTAINCNAVFVSDADDFEKKVLSKRDASPHKDIPADILEKIICGVLLSNSVSDDQKELVRSRNDRLTY